MTIRPQFRSSAEQPDSSSDALHGGTAQLGQQAQVSPKAGEFARSITFEDETSVRHFQQARIAPPVAHRRNLVSLEAIVLAQVWHKVAATYLMGLAACVLLELRHDGEVA